MTNDRRDTLAAIVPCYNYARFVGPAIESLLMQTVSFDEIWVVDDGSTDESARVAATYVPRVRLIRQHNSGQLAACLAALEHVESRYVYFLDADDIALPELVATLRPLLKHQPAKFQFQLQAIDSSGKPTGSIFPSLSTGYDARAMRVDNRMLGFYICPPTSGNVYRVDTLRSLALSTLDGRDFTDGTLTLVMPYLGEVRSVAKPLAQYRVHESSDSQWGRPTPELLRTETARFWRRWQEASRLLGRSKPPFGRVPPAFALERELMVAGLAGTRPRVKSCLLLVLRLLRSRTPHFESLALAAWAMAFIVPSGACRRTLVQLRRAPESRPRVIERLRRRRSPYGGQNGEGRSPRASGSQSGTPGW